MFERLLSGIKAVTAPILGSREESPTPSEQSEFSPEMTPETAAGAELKRARKALDLKKSKLFRSLKSSGAWRAADAVRRKELEEEAVAAECKSQRERIERAESAVAAFQRASRETTGKQAHFHVIRGGS